MPILYSISGDRCVPTEVACDVFHYVIALEQPIDEHCDDNCFAHLIQNLPALREMVYKIAIEL